MTYSVAQAAQQLGVSSRTVKRLCDKRLMPFHMIGSRHRFTDQDIKDYLASIAFRHRPDLSRPARTQ